MELFDAVIIGAGAAGLFCAGVASQSGLRVALIDHSPKVAEKIRISGGGRSNFTNSRVTADNFLSDNPRFARSALQGYTPADFLALVKRHGIAYHEKHRGQLFCDHSAEDLIQMLLKECEAGGVLRWQGCGVQAIRTAEADDGRRFAIDTDRGSIASRALVIATGGLSIPQIGASDFGYRIARQFNIPMVETRPALVPLTFDEASWIPFAPLSGLSLPVEIACGAKKNTAHFQEDLLFTHRGLSGPAVLQISSYWRAGMPISINLVPDTDLARHFSDAKATSRKRLENTLAGIVPGRLAETWVARGPALGHDWGRPANETSDRALNALAEQLSRWQLTPNGTAGYRKAEVTAGGVSTRALSSQTMESSQPGLYFIGEVMDVTGWLGGYNFQWAWSSGFACAKALAAKLQSAN